MSNREYLSETKVDRKSLKPYVKPLLEPLGDLRSLTLGGSPGGGESGNINTRKNKMSLPIHNSVITQPGIPTPDGSGNPFNQTPTP